MNEWKPIETAPKKGKFLAYEKGHGVHECWWGQNLFDEGWANAWHFWKPTIWMELPDIPDSNSESV